MRPRVAWLLLGLILSVFILRVGFTYPQLNDTNDEGAHILCGLQWVERGLYEIEAQHPPLARIAMAAPAYFFGGLRFPETHSLWKGGPWETGPIDAYWRTLTLARLGTLPFALVAILLVFLWGNEIGGPIRGLSAALILSLAPAFIGHAGLATVDVAAATGVLAAAYAFRRCLRQATWKSVALAGAACALAVTSKFSALAFLAPILLAYVALFHRRKPQSARVAASQVAVFALTATMLIWAVYRFDFGPIETRDEGRKVGEFSLGPDGGLPATIARGLSGIPLPAPKLFQGLLELAAHNQSGHTSYLLGRWSDVGRWEYFPVVLAVKPPLPLLALTLLGIVIAFAARRDRAEALALIVPIAAVIAVSLFADINIGVRHILPAYPFAALLAAASFTAANSRRKLIAAGALLAWLSLESFAAHPDYIAYFNQIARGREQAFLLDSNLDWGQDLHRLSEYMEEHSIPSVRLFYFGAAHPGKLGVDTSILPPNDPDAGWIAVSANQLYGMLGDSAGFQFLRSRPPVDRIGKSIWLFRVRPEELGAPTR